MINTDLKNVRARVNTYNLIKRKNIITYETLAVALKKNLTIFTIFPDILSTTQTFSKSGKLLSKFQDFFKNSRLRTNPGNCGDLPSFHVIIGWFGWSSVTMYLIRSNG